MSGGGGGLVSGGGGGSVVFGQQVLQKKNPDRDQTQAPFVMSSESLNYIVPERYCVSSSSSASIDRRWGAKK